MWSFAAKELLNPITEQELVGIVLEEDIFKSVQDTANDGSEQG